MILIDCPNFKCNSQKEYDEYLSELNLIQLTCPCCHHAGNLTYHAAYLRHINHGLEKSELIVQRVRCNESGRTHALLPSYLVPYSQIPLVIQIIIAKNCLAHRSISKILELLPDYNQDTLHSLILSFIKHWNQICLSYDLKFENPTTLTSRCLSLFFRQFMQIRRIPIILYLTPT